MVPVLGQPRVEHLLDGRVRLQVAHDGLGVVAVLLHADGQVLRPRSTSHESNGPATPPIAFWWNAIRSAASFIAGTATSLRTTTPPPTTSLWPPEYFVVEWVTMSAPWAMGFCR